MNTQIFLLVLFLVVNFNSFSQTVSCDKLDAKDNVMYLKGQTVPFTGKCESYNTNKIKVLESNYKNGIPDGIETVWDGKGNKYSETSFKDGKFNGIYRQWYDNGQLEIEKVYINDKMNGKCTHWFKNGKKESEGNYTDCRETGTWTYWDVNGVKSEKKF